MADGEPDIVVVSGSPDAAELAAVTVVIQGVLDELAREKELSGNGASSAWQKSQRPIRRPVARGGWRSFAG
jgi:Acyl-CoA carboxylase epsilon subunit